jgi:hypothetical protein
MKRAYLTYTRIPIFDGEKQAIRQRIDPQSTMNDRWGNVFSFRETWANGNHLGDNRFIAIIDYEIEVEHLVDRAISLGSMFEFTKVSEEWVVEHMNEWYGENNWSFDDNNIFKDLRPIDEMI